MASREEETFVLDMKEEESTSSPLWSVRPAITSMCTKEEEEEEEGESIQDSGFPDGPKKGEKRVHKMGRRRRRRRRNPFFSFVLTPSRIWKKQREGEGPPKKEREIRMLGKKSSELNSRHFGNTEREEREWGGGRHTLQMNRVLDLKAAFQNHTFLKFQFHRRIMGINK